MQKYADVVLDRKGNVVPGAFVRVKTSANVDAVLYSDNGINPMPNPVVTDNLGGFSFYAANGRYNLLVYIGAALYTVSDDILMDDPADITTNVEARLVALEDANAGLSNPNDAAQGDNRIAVKRAAAGATAIARTQHQVNEEEVSLNDFADIPDAMAWAMSGPGRRCILLPGGDLDMSGRQFLLPPNSNEPVRPLMFKSQGGTRIMKADGGYLFDVAGDWFYDLMVEGIEFEGVQLGGGAIFNTDKIIRLLVQGNTFRFFDAVFYGTAGHYAQTIRANNNICRFHQSFMNISYGFDIKCRDNIIEFGENGYLIGTSSAGYSLYNSAFTGDVVESMAGVAFRSGATYATTIAENYYEFNKFDDINVGMSPNAHEGLEISGNWFGQHPDRVAAGAFSINWGNVAPSGAKAGGNVCYDGNLHNVQPGSGTIDMIGDCVPVGKQLYTGHTTVKDPARNAKGKALFIENGRLFITNENNYAGVDPVTGGYDFGIGAYGANVTGERIMPCVVIGTTNPQTAPGNYGTRKWAAGSEVVNAAPAIIGAPGSQYTLAGWKCITSGQGGGAGTDRWVEMRTSTGT